MTWAGWSVAKMLPAFGAAAAAITLLYLLRMRRRQLEVPFAALWHNVIRQSETRRLWRRLRRLVSWIIQLLLLALVAVALGDPRPSSWLREPQTLAIIVDTSASMAGPHEEHRTRLGAALARARSEIAALGPADRALIISAGSEVDVPLNWKRLCIHFIQFIWKFR